MNQNTSERKEGTIMRIIRDTKMSNDIKKMYNYECQVCGTYIKTSTGRYAEGAHIKPLGTPHNGPDTANNILCFCPNHHVMFDRGSFTIENDFKLTGIDGSLIVNEKHIINYSFLKYHRDSIYKPDES